GGNQNRTQGRLANRESDLFVCAPCAVLGWSHAEHIGRSLVEAPARVETRIVDRLGDADARIQSPPEPRRTMGGGVVFRRDARGRLEQAVEMARAATDGARQGLQRGLLLALLDDPADSCDQGRILSFDGGAVGVAPFAGPEACPPCALERVV